MEDYCSACLMSTEICNRIVLVGMLLCQRMSSSLACIRDLSCTARNLEVLTDFCLQEPCLIVKILPGIQALTNWSQTMPEDGSRCMAANPLSVWMSRRCCQCNCPITACQPSSCTTVLRCCAVQHCHSCKHDCNLVAAPEIAPVSSAAERRSNIWRPE